jgi:hypothetical protein
LKTSRQPGYISSGGATTMTSAQIIVSGISVVLAFLLGAVFRPFLTKYSEKKAENIATHEDINKLVEQVRAVTKTTEDIKAEISSGLWDRQKRWEMKREVLFEAAKNLAEVEDALFSFSDIFKQERKQQHALLGSI